MSDRERRLRRSTWGHPRARALLAAGGAALLGATALLGAAGAALGHGPDPSLGGRLWAQDQAVGYAWKSGQAPPAWMASAIDAAAADASLTRAARAATFSRVTGGTSVIAYGEPTGCSAAGIACFDRAAAPASFKMWFRAQGFSFDWGALRWCQGLSVIANGCFDAETVALDEFGHVEVLGHHANNPDDSDYDQAVVQAVSHARPAVGWNARALAPCDTARLQLEYDRRTWSALFSTCLAVPTAVTATASATSVYVGSSVRFTASLRTTAATSNRALTSDPISNRVVRLQRRTVGTTAWTTVATMTASTTTEGSYAITISPTATYEWRASFTPSGEGLVASGSAAMKVTVSGCTGTGCPSRPIP
ncbi:MAG: hypothetical protein HYX57_09030 [Chloroflexi bacterium]|nr:hypothetical protein [Chloroflexota bacterium]